MSSKAVFSTACFPSIEYLSAMVSFQEIIFDTAAHFIKQTNRNRFHFAGQGGIQSISVPVNHNQLFTVPENEVMLSFNSFWQRTLWRSITTAYNRSAYFEFYADGFQKILFSKNELLTDFNEAALKWILDCFGFSITFQYTKIYKPIYSDMPDYRFISNRKKNEPALEINFKKYPQVFSEAHGFIKNLSALDLVFNMGPAATDYLADQVSIPPST
jgi:hypothetical protein